MKMRKQVTAFLALKTITTKVTRRMLAGGAISILMLLFIYAGEAFARPDGSYGYNCSSCHSGRPDQNPPPVLNPIGAKTVNEGQMLAFTATATDPNGNALTFSGGNLPTGATLSAAGAFSWTPTFAQSGNYNVTITVTDNGTPAASDFEIVTITVGNVNRAPVMGTIGASQTATEGQLLTFTATASDPDGNAVTFSGSNLPTGATVSPSGVFSWTPSFTQAGPYPNVTITATDNGTPALTASQSFTIAVGNVNRPPVLTPIGARTATVGAPLTFTATATDPDGDTLVFSAGNLPAGATLTPAGAFSWTPAVGQTGTFSVTVTVTDNGTPAQNDFEIVTITVGTGANVNRPPVLNPIGAKSVNEGQPLTFTATATDPDGGPLTFSGGTLPGGATVTSAGVFTWTPDFTQAGAYNATITVTDNGALTDSETFTITVGNVNRPPVLSPSPIGNRTVTIGQTLTISITASDPDGGGLTFTSANLPSGATLTPTGAGAAAFSWTPTAGQAGTYQNATITVSDGTLTDAEVFTITVQAPTSNPTPVCAMTRNPTSLAFGSVNVGSSKTMATVIGNTGTANCTVSSLTVSGAGFAFGAGAPSVGATIAPGATVNVPVTFTPAAAGAATGSLMIGTLQVNLSGTGATVTAPPPSTTGLDYSIVSFTATEEVRLRSRTPVILRVAVKNVGTVSGSSPATLVGSLNGVEVYRRTMPVSAPVGTTTTLEFQSFTPTRVGTIRWTVTIQDQGPALNTATATTTIVRTQRDKERDERSSSRED
jgi:hypothetical protein